MSYTIITAKKSNISLYLNQIWQYKSLLKAITIRDIKLRYLQTRIGWLWTIVQPTFTVLLFSYFFTYVVKIEDSGYNYPLLVWCGVASWNYFTNFISAGGSALIQSQELIRKTYFPKIILIVSKGLSGLIDYLVTIFIITFLFLIENTSLSWKFFFIPFVILLNFMLGLTFSIWISILSNRRRDILQILPHIINVGMWLTPVFYMGSMLPQKISFLNYMNPITYIIDLTRWIFLNSPFPSPTQMLPIFITGVLFVVGFYKFKNSEKNLVDYL